MVKLQQTERIVLPYASARLHLNEGDLLLFRGHGAISWLIQKAGRGEYSHVGMASRHGGIWECVEFREFKGGRSVNLETQLTKEGHIDVYRPIPSIQVYRPTQINGKFALDIITHKFKPYRCTLYMRNITGLPYGWKRIWLMMRHKIPLLRLFVPITSTDTWYMRGIYPVCSTVVAETLERWFVDLVPNKPNVLVEPSDIARSPVVNYLFTIKSS